MSAEFFLDPTAWASVAALAAGGYAFVKESVLPAYKAVTVSDHSHTAPVEHPTPDSPYVIPVAPRLATFAGLRGAFKPLSQKPSTARRIPIVDMRRTRIAGDVTVYDERKGPDGKPRRTKRQAFRNNIAAARDVLVRAGLGAWDVRCWLVFRVHECGWTDNGCWNHASTNIKAKWSTYADAAMVRSGYVYTTNQFANCIHVLRGQFETSLESYYGYASFEDEVRYESALFHGSRYDGVAQAYERGGLAGLLDAQRILATEPGRPGWSYANTAQRLRLGNSTWSAMLARAGTEAWVR